MSERASDDRVQYIDLLKGVACVIILYAHTTTPRVGRMAVPDLALMTLLFFAAPMFFFASGMNIVNYLARHRARRGFQYARSYLAGIALMFVMSICYSVNHVSMEIPQIFQGIAMGSAGAFLLLLTPLPNWALALIAVAMYGLWLPAWLHYAPAVEPMRALSFGEGTRAFMAWVPTLPLWQRFAFVHFSLLPWLSYVLAGAATYRSIRRNPATRKGWLAFYVALGAIGWLTFLVPQWPQPRFLRTFPDMMLRNYPFTFFAWFSVTGLVTLAADRWYRGGASWPAGAGRRIAMGLEFLGRESFLFLIWHWLMLAVGSPVFVALENRTALGTMHAAIYLPFVAVATVVVATMPWAVRLGQRWRRRPHFRREAVLVLVLGTLPGLISYFARGTIRPPAMFLSFGACLAFAYLYPVWRADMRQWFVSGGDR